MTDDKETAYWRAIDRLHELGLHNEANAIRSYVRCLREKPEKTKEEKDRELIKEMNALAIELLARKEPHYFIPIDPWPPGSIYLCQTNNCDHCFVSHNNSYPECIRCGAFLMSQCQDQKTEVR